MSGNSRRFWLAGAAFGAGLMGSTAVMAAPAQLDYNQPAQPMAEALRAVAIRSGGNIVFDPASVKDLRAPALKGSYAPHEAVERLIQGSGLKLQMTAGGSLVVSKAASLPQPEAAAEVADEAPQQIEEVVVTGTHIRGHAPVGSQVVVLNAADLQEMGRGTLNDLVKAIPQIQGLGATEGTRGARGQGQITNNGAGAGVNLRGLGADATLTLVNGRRVAPSAAGAFVDVTQIPLAAVSGVEILPDGASALYGSDAIGGVVNFVLKKRYDRAESSVRYAAGAGFHEYSASQTLGRNWGSGSLLLAYEYYSRTHLIATKRDYYQSDLRALGGANFLPTSVAQSTALQSNPGNIVVGTTTYAIPKGQNGRGLTAAQLGPAGSFNLFDPQSTQDILPAQTRNSVVASFQQDITPNFQLFADGLFSHRSFEKRGQPQGANLVVPRSNPFFVSPVAGATSVTVRYSFADDYVNRVEGDSENYTLVTGANFTLPKSWKAEFYSTTGRDDLKSTTRGVVNSTRLTAALADSNPDTAFNPFGDGSATSAATLAKIEGGAFNHQRYDVNALNLGFSGPLFQLPAGAVQLAIGGEFRKERYEVSSWVDQSGPPVRGASDGALSRSITAGYAELLVPVVGAANALPGVRSLDLSVAGRIEDYDDFGSTSDPKIGVSWRPIEDLTVRASWGTSFKAPRLVQLNEGANSYRAVPLANSAAVTGAPTTPTPGASNVVAILGFANRDLKPETADTWSVGFDYAPAATGFKFSATYYKVNYKDRILGPTSGEVSAALASGQTNDIVLVRNPTQAQLDVYYNSPQFALTDAKRPASQVLAIVSQSIANYGAVRLDGLDVGGSYQLDTSDAGDFTVSANVSKLFAYEVQRLPGAAFIDLINTSSNPDDLHARASVSWRKGPFNAALAVNYLGNYLNTFSNQKVDSWTTTDLHLAYTPDTSIPALQGVSLVFDVENLFDLDPPFVNNGNDGANIGYDPEMANARGRVMALTLRKAW